MSIPEIFKTHNTRPTIYHVARWSYPEGVEFMRQLLDHRVLTDINQPDENNVTLFECAVIQGYIPMMELLIEYKSDVSTKYYPGNCKAIDFLSKYTPVTSEQLRSYVDSDEFILVKQSLKHYAPTLNDLEYAAYSNKKAFLYIFQLMQPMLTHHDLIRISQFDSGYSLVKLANLGYINKMFYDPATIKKYAEENIQDTFHHDRHATRLNFIRDIKKSIVKYHIPRLQTILNVYLNHYVISIILSKYLTI